MDTYSFYRIQDFSALIVPMIAGRVQAGFPSPAQDYHQEPLDLNKHLIGNKPATFLVEAEGDSMSPIIPHHALLVVDRSIIPKNNDIVIAVLNAEFTVKHFMRTSTGVLLIPANKRYPTIEVTQEMEFSIWGVVSRIIVDPRTIQ